MQNFLADCEDIFVQIEKGFRNVIDCRNMQKFHNFRESPQQSITLENAEVSSELNKMGPTMKGRALSRSFNGNNTTKRTHFESLKQSNSFSGTIGDSPHKSPARAASFKDKFNALAEQSKANQAVQRARLMNRVKNDFRAKPEPSLAIVISGSGRNPRAPHD